MKQSDRRILRDTAVKRIPCLHGHRCHIWMQTSYPDSAEGREKTKDA